MKRLASLLLLALLAGPLPGQTITLPATLAVPKPGLVIITPTAVDGDAVAWTGVDDGLQMVPSTLLRDDKTAVGVALQPGVFRVRAVAAKAIGGKAVLSPFSECVVTVGGTPPVPPVPPTPPGPVDSLTAAMQAAYAADTDPAKATNTAQLAGIMGNCVALAKSTGTLKTAADLQGYVKGATDLTIGPTALPAVRKAVGAYLVTKLPTDPTKPLDDALWALAATEYANVSKALKGVQK